MIFSTKGVVFHRFKYSDSKLIAKIYTEEFGLKSYLIYISKSKKSIPVQSLLQPFYILDMQVYNNEKSELQKVKEISNFFPLLSIPFEISKSTIALFLSEFLLKTLKENEADPDLFNFITDSIKIFDAEKEKHQNFHLVFLFKLCKLMGIQPENNYSEGKKTFDLKNGKFITGIPNHKHFADLKTSRLINQLFNIALDKTQILKISNSERRQLLTCIIDYYTFHLGKPGHLKSVNILKQIF